MKNRNLLLSTAFMICLFVVICLLKVRISNKEDFEGIFVLKGNSGYWLELTDDLFPEEVDRLIWGKPCIWFKKAIIFGICPSPLTPCTSFEWNKVSGRGFIKTEYPDGNKLLICLGRFINSANDLPTRGLFIGGNLPAGDPDSQIFNRDESGMAYYDGTRYFHIWCNVNEVIYAADQSMRPIYPSAWDFRGSRVLESGKSGVTLQSSHRAVTNRGSFDIVKTLFYHTGDTFFTLVTQITNSGDSPASYIYSYGDEPWLGNFGTSGGNIGWLKDRLVLNELWIDTSTNTFAGMFDYGNSNIGELHANYTRKANFIEWQSDCRPERAFFSNTNSIPVFSDKTPLDSPNNRFIGLRWGPRTLAPGQSFDFTLAIGMAGNHPESGFPVKPATGLNQE